VNYYANPVSRNENPPLRQIFPLKSVEVTNDPRQWPRSGSDGWNSAGHHPRSNWKMNASGNPRDSMIRIRHSVGAKWTSIGGHSRSSPVNQNP